MALRQALTLAMLQTKISASAFTHAQTGHHGDQRDQSEGENDYEFDQRENALHAVMPRRPQKTRIEGTTRIYTRFTLHELRMLPERSEPGHGTFGRKASSYTAYPAFFEGGLQVTRR